MTRKNFCEITIAISTYKNRVVEALKIAEQFIAQGFKVLIVHQASEPFDFTHKENLEYIFDKSRGVTISRNIAVSNVKTKYIWFMDDDISINILILKRYAEYVLGNDGDCYLCRISDENGKLRKRYPDLNKKINKFSVLNVGTIEILVKVSLLIQKNIIFPEDMGAGSELPVGDESVFMAKLIDAGLDIKATNLIPIIHPEDSSGTSFTASFLRSKKLSFKRIFGWKGHFLYIIFCIKNKDSIKQEGLKLYQAALI